MGSIFGGAVGGWLLRRALETFGWLGSVITTAMTFYNLMPPNVQAIVGRILQGHWQDLTLGAIVPLIVFFGTQVWSFKHTTSDHAVVANTTIVDKDMPNSTKKTLEAVAEGKPTLWERLTKKSH